MKFNKNINSDRAELMELVAEAVDNAAARRNLASDSSESLLELSEEEAKTVKGGHLIKLTPLIVGIIYEPDLPVAFK